MVGDKGVLKKTVTDSPLMLTFGAFLSGMCYNEGCIDNGYALACFGNE